MQVANALIKSKKHPEITNRYRRIKARRGHKKAVIAICRILLTAIWHILTDLKLYTPEGFLEPHPVNESKVLTTSQALNLLIQRGFPEHQPPDHATRKMLAFLLFLLLLFPVVLLQTEVLLPF